MTEEEAKAALKKYGPNQITERRGLPWYIKYLLTMTGFFNYLMWLGSILCFISYGV